MRLRSPYMRTQMIRIIKSHTNEKPATKAKISNLPQRHLPQRQCYMMHVSTIRKFIFLNKPIPNTNTPCLTNNMTIFIYVHKMIKFMCSLHCEQIETKHWTHYWKFYMAELRTSTQYTKHQNRHRLSHKINDGAN